VKTTDKALLLRKVSYGETSLVLTLFTLNHGLKSFLFKGAKKKRGATLMPLAFLEITYFERLENQLGQLTQADLLIHLNSIIQDPRKSAVLFFICDILNAVIREENIPQKELFMFLSAELVELDKSPFETNYPLYFLMVLTRFLGIEPHYDEDEPLFFDMHEGAFTRHAPQRAQLQLTQEELIWLSSNFLKSKDQILAHSLPRIERQRLTRILIDYYSHHVSNFSAPKSLTVLEEVFD
jgi:DNA repair protein RecO (recombination protein O)